VKMRVSAQVGLNVRRGPGVWYGRVGALAFGTVVEVRKRHGVWGRIEQPIPGWVHTGYLVPVREDVNSDWLAQEGLDISSWQRRITSTFWASAQPWIVIHKATQGTRILDPRFGERWALLRWYGWRRGGYHFFDPDVSGLEQAKVFLRVTGIQNDEYAALDFEWRPKQRDRAWVRRQVRDWLHAVEDVIGDRSRILIYTGKYIWDEVIGETDWAMDYPLWIAAHGATAPALPQGWRRWALWQYTSKGTWPGISGRVDRNRIAKWFGEQR